MSTATADPQALALILAVCLLMLALCAAAASILVIANFYCKDQGQLAVLKGSHFRNGVDVPAAERQSGSILAPQTSTSSEPYAPWPFMLRRQGGAADAPRRKRRVSLLSSASGSVLRDSDDVREWGEPVKPAVVNAELLGRIDQALSCGALRPQGADDLLKLYGFDLDEMLKEEMMTPPAIAVGTTLRARTGPR